MNRINKADTYTIILYNLRFLAFIILVFIIWIIKSCVEPDIDPLDNDICKSHEKIATIIVADTVGNGFEAVYATKEAVSKARLGEIRSRKHIHNSFEKLKIEAPKYFGNMLYTDIHDFAQFALKHNNDKDIYLSAVFVYGYDKEFLYIGKHPKIKNSATWLNQFTQQGIQYITHKEISYYKYQHKKYYRYWKCSEPYSMSSTDEHYSHFSEDDRLR